jgi:GT2 family glycosyltransferase
MLHILLPVHNRREITRNFLIHLQKQQIQNFNLIVIDDGSLDNTSQLVKEIMEKAIIINGNGHLWWAGAISLGFKYLEMNNTDDDDVVLIMNDDTEFDEDFLSEGVKYLSNNSRTLLLAKYKNELGTIRESGVFANISTLTFSEADTSNQINCLSTRGLFLTWGDFREIGNFRPRLLPHYLSDYEFTIRARKKNFQLTTTSEVCLRIFDESSGLHRLEGTSLCQNLKIMFSKKYALNPVYLMTFVILTEPRYLFRNSIRIWKSAIIELNRSRIGGVNSR